MDHLLTQKPGLKMCFVVVFQRQTILLSVFGDCFCCFGVHLGVNVDHLLTKQRGKCGPLDHLLTVQHVYMYIYIEIVLAINSYIQDRIMPHVRAASQVWPPLLALRSVSSSTRG